MPPREGGERQDRVLSVSGKKRCSHCKEELGNLPHPAADLCGGLCAVGGSAGGCCGDCGGCGGTQENLTFHFVTTPTLSAILSSSLSSPSPNVLFFDPPLSLLPQVAEQP